MIKKLLMILLIIVISICWLLHSTNPLDYEILGAVKPITIIQFSSFILFALMLDYARPLIRKVNFNFAYIIIFLLILGTLFEMLWSFNFWFATYSINVLEGQSKGAETLDKLEYEVGQYNKFIEKERSLNLSAKKNSLFFIMSVYLLFFVWRVENDVN